MVNTNRPTYYTSLHDSIASICKTVLPFSSKKRRIPAIETAEQRQSRQQSENLKWQQESFHKILNLMGLCKEGIVSENEVSAFRTHLLETLIASPVEPEPVMILRDNLIFLQELLYGQCISEEEYHASKRPLLQRLAVQGAEIDARDVIVGAHKKETSNEEWSDIDLKDDKCLPNHNNISTSKKNSKESLTVKRMKGSVSAFSFVSSDRKGKLKENDVHNSNTKSSHMSHITTNPNMSEKGSVPKSILMEESLPPPLGDKAKKNPFRTIFQTVQEGSDDGGGVDNEDKVKVKSGKRAWVIDGFKKWKRKDSEDEKAPFPSIDEKSEEESYGGRLIENPVGEGPDTRQIKRKLHPNGAPTDFFVDKVLAENIKKKLSQIKTELAAKNPDIHLKDDQIEAISTRLPVDKEDLKKSFPESWCNQYGDIVLDVVRKEFKQHMREMGNQRDEKNDENSHPNRRAHCVEVTNLSSSNHGCSPVNSSSIDKGIKYNPFSICEARFRDRADRPEWDFV